MGRRVIVTPAVADASLIDGPARTILLVIGGLACAAFALAWLLCRAAAIADRVEPDCEAVCDGSPADAAPFCPICDEPQLYTSTEVYDHLAVEALHADLAAFERGER